VVATNSISVVASSSKQQQVVQTEQYTITITAIDGGSLVSSPVSIVTHIYI